MCDHRQPPDPPDPPGEAKGAGTTANPPHPLPGSNVTLLLAKSEILELQRCVRRALTHFEKRFSGNFWMKV